MSKADQVVLERRLRPIYEALDCNNAKKGIQEADKVLKKHPNTTCAKVLRALCLIRSERLTEAMTIIEAIDVAGAKHDESTLQAFIHCYKEAGIPERISELYENVCQTEPTEINLTQLFMAYVRTREYKKQQTTSLRLYKDFGNAPYYFWSVMSIIMQAIENPNLAEKMLYPLADKMFQTQIKKTGYTEGSCAELELQMMIMEGQHKWKELHEFLSDSTALALPSAPIFLNEKKAEYLVKMEDFEELMRITEAEIEKMVDNWKMWVYRHNATLEILKKKFEKGDKAGAKRFFEEVVKFVKNHVKSPEKKQRGPFMARLELLKILSKDEKIAEKVNLSLIGDPVSLIFQYIELFYTRPVCFNDVQLYFELLDDEQKKKLIEKLTKWIEGVSQEEDDGKESKVWAIIVYERIRRVFGEWEKMDKKQHRQHFHQLIAQIVQNGRGELAQGALCHIAISSLWDAWRKNDDQEQFYEMILLLELVAQQNKTDPVCKLALIRAYSHIGNTSRVAALYKLLDIKAVQNDTLGYLSFPSFELAGRFNLALISNTQLGYVYDQAEKEIMDCLVGAYKNGKFAQVPRLIVISDRMKKSAQAVGCDVLNRYLSALFVIENLSEAVTTCYGDEEPIDWDNLIDNRDLSVIPAIENESYSTLLDDMKQRTFKEFIDITRLRHSICRTIAAIGRVQREGVDVEKAKKQFGEELLAFVEHLKKCQNDYPSFEVPSRLMQSPPPLCFAQWVHSGGLPIIQRIFEAAKSVVDRVGGEESPLAENALGTAEQLKEELGKIVEAIFSQKRKPTRRFWLREPIMAASRLLQTLAILQLAIGLIEKISRPKTVSSTEQQAKKKGAKTQEPSRSSVYCTSLLREISNAAHSLGEKVLEMSREVGGDDLIPLTIADDLGQLRILLEHYRPSADSRIRRAYIMALEDMQTTISTRF